MGFKAGFLVNGNTYLSAHSSEPGSYGANEITGEGYTRVATTLSANAEGNVNIGANIEILIPPSTTITHVGLWIGSDFVYSMPLAAAETFANGGNLDISQYQITLTE